MFLLISNLEIKELLIIHPIILIKILDVFLGYLSSFVSLPQKKTDDGTSNQKCTKSTKQNRFPIVHENVDSWLILMQKIFYQEIKIFFNKFFLNNGLMAVECYQRSLDA